VIASGDGAEGYLDLNTSTSDVVTLGTDLLGSDITVVASGNGSYTSAEAYINADGFIDDIEVTASGDGSLASLDLEFNGEVQGDINVTASGTSSDANLDLDDNVTYVNTNVTVTASGEDSDANADLRNTAANSTVGNIVVTAAGESADADLRFDMNGTVTGNISVIASGDGAEGYLDLNTSTSDVVTLGTDLLGSDITVVASGNGSGTSAEAYIDAVGDIDDIEVTASGLESYAYLDLDFVGDIHDDVTAIASGNDGYANIQMNLDGRILGDISATASANGSFASIDIENFNSSSSTYQSVNLAPLFNEIIAIQNAANATVGSLQAMIDNPSLRPSVSLVINGSMFTHTFDAYELEFDRGDDLHDEYTITYALQSAWSNIFDQIRAAHALDPENIPYILSNQRQISQLGDAGTVFDFDFTEDEVFDAISRNNIGVRFDMYWDSSFGTVPPAVITIIKDDQTSSPLVVTNTSPGTEYRDIELGSVTANVAVSAIATGNDSFAKVQIDNSFGHLGNLTAIADGSDSSAEIDIDFRGTITGNVSVIASGYSAEASIVVGISSDMPNDDVAIGTPVELDLGYISVIASGRSAEANAELYKVYGNIAGNVDVKALSDYASADLELNYHGTIGGDILVEASGRSSDAALEIYAEDYREDAGVNSITLTNASVSVIASAYSSDAYLYLGDAQGTIESLTVQATGEGSVASAEIDFTGTLSSGISVIADGGPRGINEEEYWTGAEASLVMSAGRTEVQSVELAQLYFAFANRVADDTNQDNHTQGGQTLADPTTAFILEGDVISLNVDGIVLDVLIDQDYGHQEISEFGDYLVAEINLAIDAYNSNPSNTDIRFRVFADNEQPNERQQTGLIIPTIKIVWDDAGGHDAAFFTSATWSTKYEFSTYNEGRDGHVITLDNNVTQNVTVHATQGSDEAFLNIDDIDGFVDNLSVKAVGTSADATAMIRFDDGHVVNTDIVAGSQTAVVNLHISQTAHTDTVTVGGDGSVSLQYVDHVVSSIDLSGLRNPNFNELPLEDASDMHQVWGAFNLDLMTPDTVIIGDEAEFADNKITITAFDEHKDSININQQPNQYFSDLAHDYLDWTTSSADAHYNYWSSSSTDAMFGGYQAWDLYQDGDTWTTVDEFIIAARQNFLTMSDNTANYYYAVVDADGAGGEAGVGMLAYGYGEDGVNGIIELPGLDHWLDERAVADRFEMSFQYSDTLDHNENFSYAKSHAISKLSFSNATNYYLNDESDVNLNLTFDNARIDEIVMDVYKGYGDNSGFGNFDVSLTGGCNDVWLRQANISIEANGRSNATLELNQVEGSVTAINLSTREDGDLIEGTVNVDFNSADLVINDITMRALQDDSTINLRFNRGECSDVHSNHEFDNSVIIMSAGLSKHGESNEIVEYSSLNLLIDGGVGYISEINISTSESADHNNQSLTMTGFSGDLGDINLITGNDADDNLIDVSIRLTGGNNVTGSHRIDNGVQDIGDIVIDANQGSDIRLIIDGAELNDWGSIGCVDIRLDNTDITLSAISEDATAILLLNSGTLDTYYTDDVNTTIVTGSIGNIDMEARNYADINNYALAMIGGASNLSFNSSTIDLSSSSRNQATTLLQVSGTTTGRISSINLLAESTNDSGANVSSTVVIESFSGELGEDYSENNHVQVTANEAANASLTITGSSMTLSDTLEVNVRADSADAYLEITGINDTLNELILGAYNDSHIEAIIEVSGGIETTYIDVWADIGDLVVDLDISQNIFFGDVYLSGGSDGSYDADDIVNLTYRGATAETIYVGWSNAEDYNLDMNSINDDSNNKFEFNLSIMDMLDVDDVNVDTLLENMLTIYGFNGFGHFNQDIGFTDGDRISFEGISGSNYNEGSVTTDLTTFLTNADNAIGAGGGYYFGIVDRDGDLGTTDDQSGYLAMDEDASGITMLVNFADINSYSQFEFSFINNDLVL
jgi:hypothetical protein